MIEWPSVWALEARLWVGKEQITAICQTLSFSQKKTEWLQGLIMQISVESKKKKMPCGNSSSKNSHMSLVDFRSTPPCKQEHVESRDPVTIAEDPWSCAEESMQGLCLWLKQEGYKDRFGQGHRLFWHLPTNWDSVNLKEERYDFSSYVSPFISQILHHRCIPWDSLCLFLQDPLAHALGISFIENKCNVTCNISDNYK